MSTWMKVEDQAGTRGSFIGNADDVAQWIRDEFVDGGDEEVGAVAEKLANDLENLERGNEIEQGAITYLAISLDEWEPEDFEVAIPSDDGEYLIDVDVAELDVPKLKWLLGGSADVDEYNFYRWAIENRHA